VLEVETAETDLDEMWALVEPALQSALDGILCDARRGG
jgi:hypothetical protein